MAGHKKDVDRLRQAGYRVRKLGDYPKVSFRVHNDTLASFRKVSDNLGYKLQDAITEALDEWLDRQKEINKRSR